MQPFWSFLVRYVDRPRFCAILMFLGLAGIIFGVRRNASLKVKGALTAGIMTVALLLTEVQAPIPGVSGLDVGMVGVHLMLIAAVMVAIYLLWFELPPGTWIRAWRARRKSP